LEHISTYSGIISKDGTIFIGAETLETFLYSTYSGISGTLFDVAKALEHTSTNFGIISKDGTLRDGAEALKTYLY
jgi:hypothetical protein